MRDFTKSDTHQLKVGQLQSLWEESKSRADIYYTFIYFRIQRSQFSMLVQQIEVFRQILSESLISFCPQERRKRGRTSDCFSLNALTVIIAHHKPLHFKPYAAEEKRFS